MAQRTRSAAAERVKQLRERIDRWRSTRVKLWPMPAALWDEATILARELGVHPVRRALRVNYESLRQRVEEGGAFPGRSAEAAGVATGEFVELSGAQLLGLPVAAAGPVIELSDKNGVRLTVRLTAGSTVDMALLVEAFRGRRA